MLAAFPCWMIVVAAFANSDDEPLVLAPAATRTVDYSRDIEPILTKSCVSCHGAKKQKGGLALHRKGLALSGGDEGADIIPGDSAKSRLIQYVGGINEDHLMPPDGFGESLTVEQVGLLRAWIDQGMAWPESAQGREERSDHWAFQRPTHPEPPAVKAESWVKNPIDRFVLARLESDGLHPAPEADRATLIRRLSLDLVGLPPTVAEVDTFTADPSPDAYDRLVDRLLASPHYGERWARKWLDLARYADTNGYEKDRERSIWPYRDWVIRALNDDKPFDQFTVEQIAGDLLPNATLDQKVATGFHRNTMINEEGGIDVAEFRFASLVDRVQTTGTTWLGLTVQCAQCHTHKYDPVTQREYYRLMAFFDDTDEPEINLPDPAITAQRAAISRQIAQLEADLPNRFPDIDSTIQWSVAHPTSASGENAPVAIRDDGSICAVGSTPATDRTELRFAVDLAKIDAIRLEALTDPTLPKKGPGRATNGNFVLGEIRVAAIGSSGQEIPLVLNSPEADVEQGGFEVRKAIDGDPKTGWAVDVGPEALNRDHQATFRVASKPGLTGATQLVVRLDQSFGGDHVLGRFRLQTGSKPVTAESSVEDRRAARLQAKFLEWQARLKLTRWNIITPSSVTSAKGATLKVLPDESVLASGDKPNNDTYRVEIPLGSVPITAVRLETLPDESLPEGGPGRAPLFSIGSFLLTEAKIAVEQAQDSTPQPVAIRDASADFAEAGRSASHAIDGRVDTGWSVGGGIGKPHAIVFRLAEPLAGLPGSRLVLTLEQKYIHQMTIGRFRIATTTDVNPPVASPLAADLETIALLPPDQRSSDQADALRSHFLRTTPELSQAHRAIADLRRSMPAYTTTMVMQARPATEHRVTRLHRRGEFLQATAPVEPGVPAILHSLPSDVVPDRLAFARWLVAEENPLVGRVVMNRAWMAFFGRGLVATPDDFGVRGDRPTHPALLDWLATEFPRRGWSQKAMHRLIVTSATYRQASEASPELAALDPRNERLARGARFRIDAEIIRDVALSAAGLLNLEVGGPSVFPPQPAGVTSLAYGNVGWPTSKGADRYRRGLYTYTKRTAPFAAFATFDAPTPEVTCARRDRSNTPLQALTLMNDPAMVEAARGLGRRIIAEGPADAEGRATWAFRVVLGRPPLTEERTMLVAFVAQQAERIKRGELKPGSINGPKAGVEDADLAAWTTLARAVLNLDETINKE